MTPPLTLRDAVEDTAYGDRLRDLRLRGGYVPLSVAAEALGISVADYSSLERGRKTLSTEDWQRALTLLSKLVEQDNG